MKMGINATKEMLGFILSLGNALGNSLEDGQITIGDLTNFVAPLMDAGTAFATASEIPMELADLTDDEITELLAYAKTTFNIPEKDVDDVIDCAFDTMVQIHILVQKIKFLHK